MSSFQLAPETVLNDNKKNHIEHECGTNLPTAALNNRSKRLPGCLTVGI